MSDEQNERASATPRILTLDEILAADDLTEQTVEIEEWGGAIRVRALNRGELKKAFRLATKGGEVDNDALESFLVCWASVEPKITPPFFAKLAEKNAGAVVKLIGAIMGLSGVDDAALAKARATFRD